jgi:hypothetical protein
MTDETRKERERIYQEVGYKLQQVWDALPADARTAIRDPITEMTVALRRVLTTRPFSD